MSAHAIDYSRSTRAVCKGPPPCVGSPIPVGCLRYGEIIKGEFGETVSWRHWGCVTPDILRTLAGIDMNTVPGFSNIKHEDQQKVRRAIAVRHVDYADVPATAKIALPQTPPAMLVDHSIPGQYAGALVGQKRKYDAAEASGSNFYSNILQNALQRPCGLQQEEDEEVIPAESEQVDELLAVTKTSIVGIQYYKGLVAPGEQVRLVREPHNQYDRNAIQVMNIGGSQVGHISRGVAAKLAPLLDQRLVTVEGVMHEGNMTGFSYSLSMSLNIYGPPDKQNMLQSMLSWTTPQQKTPSQRGRAGAPGVSSAALYGGVPPTHAPALASTIELPGPSQGVGMPSQIQQEAFGMQNEAFARAAELRQMLSGLERVDDENRRTSLLDTLCSMGDLLKLPVHPNPPSLANGELMVDLLKHQSQALQWCVDHEYPKLPTQESDAPVQFWQYRKAGNKAYYFNIATKSPQDINAPPVLGRGALVADSMGLGKTLTMIALILATKKDVPRQYSNSTLVVAPLSIISNWEKQIDEHCVRGALSVCVYYGATRNMTLQQLMKYDVVITTYQVVSGDVDFSSAQNGIDGPGPAKKKRMGKGLFGVKWKRVILDEGHSIRNPKTKMAMSACMLTAERRWVLSGTPIINSPKDLGSILTFLRICNPLDNEDFFKRLVMRPLQRGDPSGAELLRALMNHICIRRTKEMQDSEGNALVSLPPVDITLVPVALGSEQRALYDAVELVSRQRIENLINEVGQMTPTATTNVLSMLTRLRQIVLHPGLIPANYLDQLRAGDVDSPKGNVQITPELKAKLESAILQAIEDNEECPICFNVVTDPRITSCSHVFCLACISEVVSRDRRCPMDRRPLTMQDLVVPPPLTDLTQVSVKHDMNESNLCEGPSAKIDQLVHLLQLIPNDAKSLVFSQFTSFLDKIGEALEEHGIPYVRFDGQLSARRRQEVLERFSIPFEFEPDESPAPGEPLPRTPSVPLDEEVITDKNDPGYVTGNDSDDDDFEESIMTRVKKSRTKDKKAKGKGKARAIPAARRVFDGSAFYAKNPKVMLISLKAGALGLNLTVANHVFLMDPWWQEGIESQAIDRCNRIGQKKSVHVYQLIAENTVESKVIEIQEKKKRLIEHAFSGTQRTETQREKREARLQDIVRLFGIGDRDK